MTKKQKYLDLLERTIWTAVQAFAGVLIGLQLTSEIEWDTVFASAGFAALIAAMKCLVAFHIGNDESAAMPETQPTSTTKGK
jgi:hypothetical protein